jgi:hypothetical protein
MRTDFMQSDPWRTSGHEHFACGLFLHSGPFTYGPLLTACGPFFVLADCLYVMGGPLSLARGQFSFIGTSSGLFWSLALRVRTIISASGPFSIALHTWSVFYQTYGPLLAACGPFSFSRTFYMLWVDLCHWFADRFHSSGPQLDFSGHSRFRRGPFSVTLASRANAFSSFFTCARFARGPLVSRARTRGALRAPMCAARIHAARFDLLPLARFARGRAAGFAQRCAPREHARRASRADARGSFFLKWGGGGPRPPALPPRSAPDMELARACFVKRVDISNICSKVNTSFERNI